METLSDPVVLNDWHPVASSAALDVAGLQAATLLGQEIVVWRGNDGQVHAWADRCPHRGAQLSLGRVEGDRLACAYHGWQFDGAGQCRLQPAQPRERPPAAACVKTFQAREAYGLVWVCLGEPAVELAPVPEHSNSGLRSVVAGPHSVDACGTRIIENFLDMAHFGFVHTGVLGDVEHAEVPDYAVAAFDDGQGERGMKGVIASGCFAYQPKPNLNQSADGAMVEYTYRVLRPLTAVLTKLPQRGAGVTEAISIHLQPINEFRCHAWMVMAVAADTPATDEELRERQLRIFTQDIAILESQRPRQIPLAPGAEISQRADRLSTAYRRMLKDLNIRYGVV